MVCKEYKKFSHSGMQSTNSISAVTVNKCFETLLDHLNAGPLGKVNWYRRFMKRTLGVLLFRLARGCDALSWGVAIVTNLEP